MDKQQSEKILGNILETLGLQDDRVETIFKLMEALGWSYNDAKSFIGPIPQQTVVEIKYQDEIDTARQRIAFREWYETKVETVHPMNIAYDMFLESLKVKTELETQSENHERDAKLFKGWIYRIANKLSDFTGIDLDTDEGTKAFIGQRVLDALEEYFTRSNVKREVSKPANSTQLTAVAWFYVRSNQTTGVTSSLDIAKYSAGDDGSVFALNKYDAVTFGGRIQPPSAYWATQNEVSYLVRDTISGKERYPHVQQWIPLYLQPEAYDYADTLRV